MDRNTSKIEFKHTDARVNALLRPKAGSVRPTRHSCRFNRNEDQYLLLDKEISVPALPVHHNMDNYTPPPGYTEMMLQLAADLMAEVPELVAGTTWNFDPANLHIPVFYRLTEIGSQTYLYLTRVDLTCHPLESVITAEGSNNRTHAYRTRKLFFESDYLPLLKITREGDATIAYPRQTIPGTWKGEAGQGYMIHGIWMDADINKFFSKLILPAGTRNHPYYPITCKQRCVCLNAFGMAGPVILDRIREVLEPMLDQMLEDLQTSAFSELMPLFKQLKALVPQTLAEPWKNLSVKPILDENDQKEYIVEF